MKNLKLKVLISVMLSGKGNKNIQHKHTTCKQDLDTDDVHDYTSEFV